MRVVDLDRDMSDVIPTGTTRDSEYLFARMTEETLAQTHPGEGRRILDVASGVGQDAIALQARGARVVGAEPSRRMIGLAALQAAKSDGALPRWVRCWSDGLPFADGAFDAALCKGALDHFDRPELAISEMARVVRPGGRVVLAIANFDSLACRASRAWDDLHERRLGHPARRGRRGYDVPSDHFTRYEIDLMREQASRHVDLDVVEGISVGWGLPAWTRVTDRLPGFVVGPALRALDALARAVPAWADVIVLAGAPRARA
ncbi:MAG TPA: methyltransferase domain-containing protein [Myxococcota bacterium]|nr:methyltransferase domain-containing protein [Myxococcota bacterium]